jgi:hypothetical protein
MDAPPAKAVVRALLKRHGTTYAEEIGIGRLDRSGPSPLFRLLCAALLLSARISADLAITAARALADNGWTTPRKLADATWAQRTKVLNRALLKEFKGIGDVGADVFMREVQRAWREARPFFDERALASARRLGLPDDRGELARLAPRGDTARLAAALVRSALAKDDRDIVETAVSGGRR